MCVGSVCMRVTNVVPHACRVVLGVQVSRPDLLVLGTAFFATLILGIEEGVLVACVLSLAIVIKQTTSPHWALLGRLVRPPRCLARVSMLASSHRSVRMHPPHVVASHTPPCGTTFPGFQTRSPCVASQLFSSTRVSTLPTLPCFRYGARCQPAHRLRVRSRGVVSVVQQPQHLILDVAADVSRQGEPPYLRHFSTQDAEDTPLPGGNVSVASFEGGDNGSVKLDGSSVIGAGASVAGDLHHNLQVHDEEGENGGELGLVVHGRHDTQGRRVMHGLEVLNFPAGTRHVVVDMGAVSSIDFSAMHMLTDLPTDLARACLSNVKLWLVNMRGPTRDALRRMLNKVAAIRMKEVAKAAKALMRQKYARGMRPPTPNTAIELSMFSTPGGESRSKEPVLDRRLFCMVRGRVVCSRWCVRGVCGRRRCVRRCTPDTGSWLRRDTHRTSTSRCSSCCASIPSAPSLVTACTARGRGRALPFAPSSAAWPVGCTVRPPRRGPRATCKWTPSSAREAPRTM